MNIDPSEPEVLISYVSRKLEKDAAKLEDERNKLKKAIQDKMKKINAKATSIEKLV